MKQLMKRIRVVLSFCILLIGCSESTNHQVLRFATSAEYPPFEYNDHGEIKGFDIDLAKLIAKELGKEAVFDDMKFSTVLSALNAGQDDLAISTITITPQREKNFDFSTPYYFEGMAAVYPAHQPVTEAAQLKGKKTAVQLGSVMEIWLREHYPDVQMTAFDSNTQAIEALLAGHVNVVLMDAAQGNVFSKKHSGLSYSVIAKAENGYALAFKKGSPLKASVDHALEKLKENGEIERLEKIWLTGAS